MKDQGKKERGPALVFVCSLFESTGASRFDVICRSGRADAFGSRPGQLARSTVWMAVPENPRLHYRWQSIRVRRPGASCMALTSARGAEPPFSRWQTISAPWPTSWTLLDASQQLLRYSIQSLSTCYSLPGLPTYSSTCSRREPMWLFRR